MPTFSTAYNRRSQALDATDRSDLRQVHEKIFDALEAQLLAMIPLLISVFTLVLNLFNVDVDTATLLVQQWIQLMTIIDDEINRLLLIDQDIADIHPADELPRGHACAPINPFSLADFHESDDECMKATNFRLSEVISLLQFFGLEQMQGNDGFIRVEEFEGHRFTGQEILLFVLKKLKSGATYDDLCSGWFGGDGRRWSLAVNWFIRLADERFQAHINFRLLERYQNQFDYFASMIKERIKRGFNVQHENGEWEFVEGLEYEDPNNPFIVFGLLDCCMFPTSRPGSGPSAREEGVARNPNHFEIQLSVYNGWKGIHGIKILSILLPNGLMAMYGPHSLRHNDIESVHCSHLNNFLLQIQGNNPVKYCVFGDGIFFHLATEDSAIRSYYRNVLFGGLTELQQHENMIMRKVRVFVEHRYAVIKNCWKIVHDKNSWKLMDTSSVIPAKLRLICFLSNVYACGRGCTFSSSFSCPPPSVDEYLFGE